jgi:hypothetical protein
MEIDSLKHNFAEKIYCQQKRPCRHFIFIDTTEDGIKSKLDPLAIKENLSLVF